LLECRREDRLILIVDNASINESFEQLKIAFSSDNMVEIVRSSKNGGYAKGNNYGLRYIEKYNPKYVCIINNDVHFDSGLVERLAKRYESIPNAGIISPIQMLPSGKKAVFRSLSFPTFKDDCLSYLCRMRIKQPHEYIEDPGLSNLQSVFIVPGAFLFVDYQRFASIGFFYEGTFLYGEERFLGSRVKDAGMQNYIVLDESYVHEHGTTINSSASKRKQYQLMYESHKLFASEIRGDNWFKRFALTMSYVLFVMRYFITSKIRKTN